MKIVAVEKFAKQAVWLPTDFISADNNSRKNLVDTFRTFFLPSFLPFPSSPTPIFPLYLPHYCNHVSVNKSNGKNDMSNQHQTRTDPLVVRKLPPPIFCNEIIVIHHLVQQETGLTAACQALQIIVRKINVNQKWYFFIFFFHFSSTKPKVRPPRRRISERIA